jgi:hypothetical protein
VGAVEGLLEGAQLGIVEGALLGLCEGAIEGPLEGPMLGRLEGSPLGVLDGKREGETEGCSCLKDVGERHNEQRRMIDDHPPPSHPGLPLTTKAVGTYRIDKARGLRRNAHSGRGGSSTR